MSPRELNYFHNNLKSQALHHLLYSTSTLLNLWQTTIYWSLQHSHKTGQLNLNENEHWHQINLLHLHLVHIFPALACFLNCMLTNCVLKRGLWKIYGLVMTIWVFVDIYSFDREMITGWIDERDYGKSLMVISCMIAVQCGVYVVICLIDEKYKSELKHEI